MTSGSENSTPYDATVWKKLHPSQTQFRTYTNYAWVVNESTGFIKIPTPLLYDVVAALIAVILGITVPRQNAVGIVTGPVSGLVWWGWSYTYNKFEYNNYYQINFKVSKYQILYILYGYYLFFPEFSEPKICIFNKHICKNGKSSVSYHYITE